MPFGKKIMRRRGHHAVNSQDLQPCRAHHGYPKSGSCFNSNQTGGDCIVALRVISNAAIPGQAKPATRMGSNSQPLDPNIGKKNSRERFWIVDLAHNPRGICSARFQLDTQPGDL
jgi:hypothetical protein